MNRWEVEPPTEPGTFVVWWPLFDRYALVEVVRIEPGFDLPNGAKVRGNRPWLQINELSRARVGGQYIGGKLKRWWLRACLGHQPPQWMRLELPNPAIFGLLSKQEEERAVAAKARETRHAKWLAENKPKPKRKKAR